MVHTTLYLEGRYTTKSGYRNLLLRITNGTDWSSVSMKIKLKSNEWTGYKVVGRNDAMHLNAIIGKKKADIDMKLLNLSLEYDLESMRASEIRKLVTAETTNKNTKKGVLFSDVLSQYLDNDLSDGTREIYKALSRKIENYSGKNTRIKDIDHNYIVGFNKYLSQTQGINGRAIYLRHLRAICNHALHTRIISESPFEHFKVRTEETAHRTISIEDLRKLYHYPISQSQEKYRDYFFLMFFLIGINTTDLLKAKHANVVNGRLEYIRAKTHKKYSVKIEPEAQALLDKYKGANYLVEALDHIKYIKSFLKMINKELRNIGGIEKQLMPTDDLFVEPEYADIFTPVVPKISTYYARHTWATIASDLGIPIDVISSALGHSLGHRTTLIYVKFDQQKVDDANRKVIDYLLKSDGS